jgi:hypothetical protein
MPNFRVEVSRDWGIRELIVAVDSATFGDLVGPDHARATDITDADRIEQRVTDPKAHQESDCHREPRDGQVGNERLATVAQAATLEQHPGDQVEEPECDEDCPDRE